jgi:thymidylate kinase
MIVMTDRYPQAQLTGFNDGPLLADLASSRSGLLRAFANWEAVPYRWADEQPPDVVVRLDITPDVAEERKPETGRVEIERRVRAIQSLRYRDGATVVNVDANRPFSDVCRDVRTAIWRNL